MAIRNTKPAALLTDNTVRLICAILLTDYQSGEPATEIADWADVACESFDTPQQGAGTIARAVEAGVVWHDNHPGEEAVGITDEGWARFQSMFGKCDENDCEAFRSLAHTALRSLQDG